MAEKQAPVEQPVSPFRDMAALSENFIPRSEFNALLEKFNEVSDAYEKQSKSFEGVDIKKMTGRLQELEGKVRTHNYQRAYSSLVDELGINPDFSDEVFELAKLTLDQDEPDVKKMKSVLKDFLDLKPKFKAPAQSEQQQQTGQQDDREIIADPSAQPKPKLHAPESGRGGRATPPGRFTYRATDLSDPEWMRANGVAYAKAIQDKSAYKVG